MATPQARETSWKHFLPARKSPLVCRLRSLPFFHPQFLRGKNGFEDPVSNLLWIPTFYNTDSNHYSIHMHFKKSIFIFAKFFQIHENHQTQQISTCCLHNLNWSESLLLHQLLGYCTFLRPGNLLQDWNLSTYLLFFLSPHCSQCMQPIPSIFPYVPSVLLFKNLAFFFPPIFSFILSPFFQKETFLSPTKKICHFPFPEILVIFLPKYMAARFLMPQKAKKYDLEHL